MRASSVIDDDAGLRPRATRCSSALLPPPAPPMRVCPNETGSRCHPPMRCHDRGMEIDKLSLLELLTLTWEQAISIVLGTVVMYLFLLALLRMLGQRITAKLSTYDMAAIVIVGAIAGRATLGHVPTLTGGIIALITLFTMRWLLGMAKRSARGESWINNQPIVVMAGTDIFDDVLHKANISTEELWMALRLAGIRNDDEVATVILEPTGAMSVLKRGVPIDPRILENVKGRERIPNELIGDHYPGDQEG